MLIDQSVLAAVKGYPWLPDLRRAAGGPEATAFFYASGHLERHTVVPKFVVSTLFGKGAVHTLDAGGLGLTFR